ncbi:hypothetical protein FWK45_08900 [Histophilus somni]|uniref:Uncharacterized protein n=1 Tax=Histophilus somni TaxID=731 RepID=A0A9Q6Z2F9_HISSO|nr:hypothetical protein FWK43_01350 [Histophilus somni]QEH11545.1 hypothetical protein FWK47_01335 [Histophilus somni]QEH13467.1 hypothetical protein FWK44_08865 [Histophilus somni]QEH15227.1 hypothetical protein FWK46_01340 [Histophilus somni]QEH17009.1 hypothetical protein FWK50_01330 [Histophilus somni]
MGGNCTVQEFIVELGLDKEVLSEREKRLLDMVYLSQQLRIQGILQEELTPQFLLDNLLEEDYWQILEALIALRKKLSADGESLNPPEVENSKNTV